MIEANVQEDTISSRITNQALQTTKHREIGACIRRRKPKHRPKTHLQESDQFNDDEREHER